MLNTNYQEGLSVIAEDMRQKMRSRAVTDIPPNQIQSFEHVLANINKLNRSLEAVIAVRSVKSFFPFPLLPDLLTDSITNMRAFVGRKRILLSRGSLVNIRERHGQRT